MVGDRDDGRGGRGPEGPAFPRRKPTTDRFLPAAVTRTGSAWFFGSRRQRGQRAAPRRASAAPSHGPFPGTPSCYNDAHPDAGTRMPRTKVPAMAGTAELNGMIERVPPDVLGLLADGRPRTKAAIVEALAGRHDREDVALALVQRAVTGRVTEKNGRYALAAES